MWWILVLVLACEPDDDKMSPLECGDFDAWSEIPSPFEGERCFAWGDLSGNTSYGGPVCKPIGGFTLKPCALPGSTEVP